MKVDFLIIGQGIAGSTLALELLNREKSVLVVDRQDAGSSTRVAAGLVTPLTGKGMNPAWRQEEYLPKAVAYYHALEKVSGRRLYRKTPVVRLFSSEKERDKWQEKARDHDQWAFEMARVEGPFKLGLGGIEMSQGAWLDTLAFLQVVKDKLIDSGAWRDGEFAEDDVAFEDDMVRWQDVFAGKIILCQGAYGLSGVDGYNGWFSHIPHRSAKGEVLSLWVGGLDETKRYHCNGWLAPREGGMWKAGANYDWNHLNSIPTEAGKNEVITKLRTWLDEGDVPMEVIGHEAGVRPIIRNSRPLIGFHPAMPQVGFFNGLGSKGTLMAPAVAEHFAQHLCGECDLDGDLSLASFETPDWA
ncbi:MAG: FAD-binding oxidoreductase [Akkermansiaceae bacterium]|nr:FAD-binding oxidoreductase [Akkermansiaceae bacterium]